MGLPRKVTDDDPPTRVGRDSRPALFAHALRMTNRRAKGCDEVASARTLAPPVLFVVREAFPEGKGPVDLLGEDQARKFVGESHG